ncbi:MAG: GNAT family N-acetyltransferase [Streptosporangiaceae bacterium]
MRIEQFGADGDPRLVGACHDIMVAATAADHPGLPPMSRVVFDGWLTTGWTGEPRETWLGCGPDGSVAGWYLLEVPDRDNRHLGIVEAFVDPARRRLGFGRALLRHAAERALADGRRLLVKLAMLDWLAEAEPGRRWIITGNAETNEHMIAINEALGYQPFGRPVLSFEVPAADVTGAQS